MIPQWTASGELPSGLHKTTLEEVRNRFGYNVRRQILIAGLSRALENLRAAGVTRVFLDGSFVATKPEPNDIDGCWDADEHVNVEALDPVFLDFSHHRQAMREKYGVDFFIANTIELGSGMPFVEFFQVNRDGQPKGILLIELTR